MGNMSYCRFRNTLEDLDDCYDNWGHPSEQEVPNEEEIKARTRLLKLCQKIVLDYGED